MIFNDIRIKLSVLKSLLVFILYTITMKKFYVWGWLLLLSAILWQVLAADVSVEDLSSKYSSCNASESKDVSYYLEEWKTVKSYPADAYFSTHTFGVLPTSSSKVQIWKNGVINNCWKWSWDSNYIPASNASNKYIIFQNYDGCEFKKPSTTKENDRDRIDAQIHYYIAYKHLMPNGTEKASLWWFYKKNGESAYRCENWTLTTSPWSCAKTEKKFDPETHTHVWECINYRIYWCWDWVLNGRNWSTSYENGTYTEKCDPKDPNKEWWWDWGCSASCEPIENPKVPPKCVSSYEGSHYNTKYPAAYLNADMILCNPGEVASFVGPVEPGRTYTWKCNWVAWTTPDECSAKELWCWDGKLQADYEDCDYNDANHTNWGEKECDTSCKLTDKKVYDLALKKELKNGSKKYKLWDTIEYKITVINQGNLTAKNIEITDYIPDGLILNDSNWTQVGSKAKTVIESEILPKEEKIITITFTIDPNFKWTEIVNGAEISKDNSNDYGLEDIDSNPDKDPDDDCIVEYDHIVDGNGKAYSEDGKACDETTDEDDHDFVPVTLDEEPGIPTIDKELVWDKKHPYKVWELVGFKMVFKNTTNKTVRHAIIRDFLPLNLEYVSSDIHGVSPILSWLSKKDGVTVLEYSWFDLAPNQEWYLIMTGRVLSTNLENRVNDVCIYGNDQENSYKCDQAEYLRNGIKIEKTVNKKEVVLGDVIEYTIKVTALDWEYTGYTIRDVLPRGISFYGYTLNSASSSIKYVESFSTGLTSTWLDTMTWNYVFENGFKKWDVLTIKFKAKITELYKKYSTNVACVLVPGEDEICDEEDVVLLTIKKYVSDSVNWPWYDTWMTLENGKLAYFKIVVYWVDPLEKFIVKDSLNNSKLLFKNESWSLANNVFTWTIKFGSKNTWEKDYKITPRVNAVTWATQLSWDVYMSKWQFMSWDVFEAIFMAEKKADEENIACVYYDISGEEVKDCDPAKVTSQTWKLLTIQKDVSKTFDNWYVPADTDGAALSLNSNSSVNEKTVYFKIIVKDAKIALTWFKVKDSLDAAMYKLLKDDTLKLANNSFTGKMEKWSKNTTPFEYVITPKISNDDKDLEWNIVMKSWSVFMEGDTFTAYFKATKLRDSNDKNTACVYYDNLGKEVSECNPAYVKRECINCNNPGWGWGRWWGWGSKCWDGNKNGIEYCDWWGTHVIPSDGRLFKNSDIRDVKYAWWTCTSSCTLKKEENAPQCFNVQNGSISIMKWEMLPFYWNMEWKLGTVNVQERKDYYDATFSMKCLSWDENKIDLKTMKCWFVIYGPWRKQLYNFTTDCITTDSWSGYKSTYPAISSFIKQNQDGWYGGSFLSKDWDNKNVFKTLDDYWQEYPTMFPISSKAIIEKFWTRDAKLKGQVGGTLWTNPKEISEFWEYKISLQTVTYNTCKGNDPYVNNEGAICEVDFAVTNNYLVQKSPYGSIASSTPLSSYKNLNGGPLFEWNSEVKGVNYSVPADLAWTLKSFISKYYAKSVEVKKSDACWTLRKVQWKSIYFTDWKNKIDLSACISPSNKPFTLVAKNWADIVIKGNLYTNAMVMTTWKIIFDAQGFRTSTGGPTACNGDLYWETTRYGHAWQMVRWIFYAWAWFDSINDKWNTDLSNTEWCNYGNLHIKWVAIGNLQSVLDKRRSELYTWFDKWCHEKNPTNCSSRKDVVLNWASVLIEYNPDLWWNLPPGAEEFNKALEVYRK